ncbi:MAG: hypothetical protein ACK4N4_11450 [Burkholderiales bacterium]
MRNGHLADFLFTGLGITPPLLTLGGHLDIAIMLFCPLLIAAALSGMREQLMRDEAEGCKSGRADLRQQRASSARPASAMTCERRPLPDA